VIRNDLFFSLKAALSDFSRPAPAQVRVVGVVRNISRTATNVSYTIEDGTGEMSARVWLDTADDDNGKTGGIE
jgi:hypothetical protein